MNTKIIFISLLFTLNVYIVRTDELQVSPELQILPCNYKSASVLPTFTHRNIKYAILSREAYGITKRYKYDDFSGGRDKGEINPLDTASREFLEEGILQEALGWNFENTKTFVNENSWAVISYSKEKNKLYAKNNSIKNVTYIVNFNQHKTDLFNNFYDARNKEKARYDKHRIAKRHRHTTEKDRIAKVRWSDLKNAIINQKHRQDPVYVCAQIMDPLSRLFYKRLITLRPFLVIKLRPFFLDQPYEEGENEKIRHYSE
ncbi:MAG TPA: hypothetical protein VLB80_05260 [Candidatus Babeliales bacterium]|nr:hypothetical protein [Candidatus Babeliales bacterium]